MGADGNASTDHFCDQGREVFGDFDFDDVSVTFGEESACVGNSFVFARVVGHERHVGHDDGVGCAPFYRRGESEENVEGHVDRAIETEDDFGGGVADEEDMDTGFFEPPGGGGVVAGEAGEGFRTLRHLAEGFERDFCGGWVGHGGG